MIEKLSIFGMDMQLLIYMKIKFMDVTVNTLDDL